MALLNPSRYSAVTSTLALVVALGGTSYAVTQITGHDIKDGTVTTRDVKNHNLKLEDLAHGTRKHLTGRRGPAGVSGPAGPTGAQGPAGPSAAIQISNDAHTPLVPSLKVLLTLHLDQGSYLATSRVEVGRLSGSLDGALCVLGVPGTSDSASVQGDADALLVTDSLAFTVGSGVDLTVSCLTGANVDAYAKELTAIRVDTASRTQGADVP